MTEYETFCVKCDHVWDQTHRMTEPHEPCPKCHSAEVRTHITGNNRVNLAPPLDSGWEYENGGRGRYFSQFETSKTCTQSPENFFRSRNDGIEAAKRRGFTIIDK